MRTRFVKTTVVLFFLVGTVTFFQNCSPLKSQQVLSEDISDPASIIHLKDSVGGVLQEKIAAAAPASSQKRGAADWKQSELELATFGAYSIDMIGPERFWFGGWISSKDPLDYLGQLERGADPTKIPGPDKIFTGVRRSNHVETGKTVTLALQVPGYHVNDPAVVVPPSTDGINRSQWLYMYFTMLDNRLAENCRKRTGNILLCPELFQGHDLGLASSVDGGKTWTYRGIVMRAQDSGDRKGAWMPTIVPVGKELHVYYSTGNDNYSTPNIFRQRYNANGVTKIGAPQAVKVPGFVNGSQLHNIDIKTASIGGRTHYLMVSNAGNHRHIQAHVSRNGIDFSELPGSPFLSSDGSDSKLITPHIEIWGENSLSAPSSGTGGSSGTQAFAFIQFTRYGSSSAYEFRRQTPIQFTLPTAP